jgi:hypothetical protein
MMGSQQVHVSLTLTADIRNSDAEIRTKPIQSCRAIGES